MILFETMEKNESKNQDPVIQAEIEHANQSSEDSDSVADTATESITDSDLPLFIDPASEELYY